MRALEQWQIKRIEDTLRQVSNMMDAPKRESCLARDVMVAWNWLYDALHDVPADETSENGIMYRMRVGQRPGDDNKRLVRKGLQVKKICGSCRYWEPGDFWGTGSGNHGVLIESKGWCTSKKNKRKRWNYCGACKGFEKRHDTGFIYCGGGGTPLEEDLENLTEKMDEFIKDNFKKQK